jgi:hypothetical protein
MGFKLPALETTAGYSLYVSPAAATNQANWLLASGINTTVLALKSNPGLLAWTVGNEISLGAKSGLSYTTNAAGVGSWSNGGVPTVVRGAAPRRAPPRAFPAADARRARPLRSPAGPTCGSL